MLVESLFKVGFALLFGRFRIAIRYVQDFYLGLGTTTLAQNEKKEHEAFMNS